jgi:hypothetical protein
MGSGGELPRSLEGEMLAHVSLIGISIPPFSSPCGSRAVSRSLVTGRIPASGGYLRTRPQNSWSFVDSTIADNRAVVASGGPDIRVGCW